MIWVVTDHAATRKTLLALIAEMGYPVEYHDCAEHVRQRMQFARPRLLIVDCGFPESFDLIESIRADVRVGGTPMIMFSVGDEDLRQEALLHGADAFVAKRAADWGELRPEIQRFAGPPREG